MIKNKKLTIILSFLICFAIILHPLLGFATTEQELQLLHVKKEEVFYYPYQEDIKQDIEKLMTEVEKLEDNYDKDTYKDILDKTYSLISAIPLDQMEGLDTSSMNFDKKKYPVDTIFYGADQFTYVIYNIIYQSANNLSGDERDDFFIELIDNLYLVFVNQYNNGGIHLETLKFITSINNIRDLFGRDVKTTLDKANILIDSLVKLTENKTSDEIKNSFTDYRLPSEYSKEELENSENEKEEIENDREEDLKDDEKDTLEDFPQPEIPENTTPPTSDSDSQNTNTNEDYLHTIGQEYLTQVKPERTESTIKNIFYTFDKSVESPVWNDSGISMDDDGTISYDELKNALSLIGRNKDCFYMEDSDAVMLIFEGKNIVLNKVETVTEDEINNLFEDRFEKLGIKVMLKSDDNVDTKNSLSSKIDAGEINSISVNGEKLILTNKPILNKNILQLPVKEVAESLGYKVTENGKTITLTYEMKNIKIENKEDETSKEDTNTITIVLNIGSQNYTINNSKNSFKTTVSETDGIVYSEFNSLSDILGYKMFYDSDSGIIEFNK